MKDKSWIKIKKLLKDVSLSYTLMDFEDIKK